MLGLADQAALADDECGAASASAGGETTSVTCDESNYDPSVDGNIVYNLATSPGTGNENYKVYIRDLKGDKTITIDDDLDTPHRYFYSQTDSDTPSDFSTSKPSAVALVYGGYGDFTVDVTGIELSARGSNQRGLRVWLDNDLDNRDWDSPAQRYRGYPRARELTLNVRDSELHTGSTAIGAHQDWNGSVTIDVRDTKIRTYGPNGAGIKAVHDQSGDMHIRAERVDILTVDGHGLLGWVYAEEDEEPNPYRGPSDMSLTAKDSMIEVAGGGCSTWNLDSSKCGGLFAYHKGSGEVEILVENSRVEAKDEAYGIWVNHGGWFDQSSGVPRDYDPKVGHELDVVINIVDSEIVAADEDAIKIERRDGSEGTNRITMDSDSSIETGGGRYGINAQGESDITVGGRITVSGGGHGIYVDDTGGTGTNTIETGANSRIEVEEAGTGIYILGVSDVTVGGRVTASGDGHGIHVDGTGGTGKNTIETGANSRIEVKGAGTAIYAQGVSDVTVKGRITASGGGHGIHVDGTGETGTGGTGANMNLIALSGSGIHASTHGADTNTIRIDAGSRIDVEGDGYGIRTQGESIITIEGQVTAESGTAVSNSGGDLDVILRGNPVVEGQFLNEDGHMINVEVNGEKLVDNGRTIRRAGYMPGAYDMAVSASDDGGFQLDQEFGPRAFIYESFAETLHTLNRLSTWQERGRAKSQAEPFWMRAEGSRATRRPEDSTTDTDWQMDRWILQAGYGFLVGEGFEAGVSVHYGDSSTDVSGATELGGGEIDTESYGLGVSLTWRLQNGVYLDAQGAANWYDSDLSGTDRGTLKSGVDGTGWALALEAGRRLEMTQLTVTPHVRVVHSEVDPDNFVDKFGSRVSSDSDDRTMGGLGVTFEGSQGWMLAEFQREFGTGTSVDVSGTSLSQRMARTRVRLAVGGEMSVLQDKLTLRGELGAASDISSSAEDTEVKAGITAHMSF